MVQLKENRILINLSIFIIYLSLLVLCFFHDLRAFILMAICFGYLARNKASTKEEKDRRDKVTIISVMLTLFMALGGSLVYFAYFILTNLPK